MKQTKTNAEPHYYSHRLRQKLNNLRLSPITVVEAPSGYGKTTAVRDYLESALPPGTPVYWFTGADESPAAGFRRLCREINKIDSKAGQRLLRIGLPSAAIVGEACDALRLIESDSETYLVIDNFQYIQPDLPRSLFSALIEHHDRKLHIVVITQMLARDMIKEATSHGVFRITSSDLRLDAEDIQRYYALSRAVISIEDASKVARYTEGWIIAVYLQLAAYKDTGSILDTSGIFALAEHLVWDALTSEQQMFLLRLSPFSTVTLRQACSICSWDTLPVYAQETLSHPFIRYENNGQYYELHNILAELLARKRQERGEAFDRDCLLNAGDYCREEGDFIRALDYYEQAGDYERMLQLDLSLFYFENIGNTPFYKLALKIAKECPGELKQKYPLSMLQITYALLTAGMDEEFDDLMNELYPMLKMGGTEDSLLTGEWLLLDSFRYLPRLDDMTAVLRQADSLFRGRCSNVVKPDSPWFYNIFAPFSVFHTAPGEAEREADALEKYIAVYSKLTNGHGSGSDVLFRVELAHYRRTLDEAEILTYKALFIAQSAGQNAVQLAATLHLAEIALEKGDTTGWKHAIASLDNSPGALQNIFVLPSALETAQGMLLMELGKAEEMAGWLRSGDFSGRQLPRMESSRMLVYLGALLGQEKYAQVVGITEGKYPDGIPMRAFSDVYLTLAAAVGYLRSGDREKALDHLSRAVRAVLPDGLLSQLLSYSLLLGDLVRDSIEQEYPAQLLLYDTARESILTAYSAVDPGLSPNDLSADLTAREREVALLAAEGLHNNEIAEKLFVSEATVRAHMRTIFQKLDIDRRAKLAEKLK